MAGRRGEVGSSRKKRRNCGNMLRGAGEEGPRRGGDEGRVL